MTARAYESNGVTVSYDRSRCLHFAECVRGLPRVFDPAARPWIDPAASTAEQIARVVERCPTGALHYEIRGTPGEQAASPTRVTALVDGPLLIRGDLRIRSAADGAEEGTETRMAACACGRTSHSPFCDGACGVNHEPAGTAVG